MTRFTRTLAALLISTACTSAQARTWQLQSVPEIPYKIDGSGCESLQCYGREAVRLAQAAGALSSVTMRTPEDCTALARSGVSVACHVGQADLMHDAPRKGAPLPDGTRTVGPWYCNSLMCFGVAAIRMADASGLRHKPVVLKTEECLTLNAAGDGGIVPCQGAGF